MKRVIHVGQNGCFWSLTPEQWHQVVRLANTDDGFDLDALGARRLKKPLSVWAEWHRIGQWCDEDWQEALEELR